MSTDGSRNWPPPKYPGATDEVKENFDLPLESDGLRMGITFENSKNTIEESETAGDLKETSLKQETFFPFTLKGDLVEREAVLARLYTKTPEVERPHEDMSAQVVARPVERARAVETTDATHTESSPHRSTNESSSNNTHVESRASHTETATHAVAPSGGSHGHHNKGGHGHNGNTLLAPGAIFSFLKGLFFLVGTQVWGGVVFIGEKLSDAVSGNKSSPKKSSSSTSNSHAHEH